MVLRSGNTWYPRAINTQTWRNVFGNQLNLWEDHAWIKKSETLQFSKLVLRETRIGVYQWQITRFRPKLLPKIFEISLWESNCDWVACVTKHKIDGWSSEPKLAKMGSWPRQLGILSSLIKNYFSQLVSITRKYRLSVFV